MSKYEVVDEPRPVEIKLTLESLRALIEGKKVEFHRFGQAPIVLYPDRYGVFMTHEKFMELERKVHFQAIEEVLRMLGEVRKDDTLIEEA